MDVAANVRSNLFLIFHLDDTIYGVPVSGVREIIPMVEITPVPNAPEDLRGVINLRGTIVPIIDLRRKLALAGREPDARTCLVVAECADQPFGFMADRVSDCLEIGDIVHPEAAPSKLPPEQTFVRGIGQHQGNIVVLLELPHFLTAADREIISIL
jgi:purine-binding chemotaxis protein CheW